MKVEFKKLPRGQAELIVELTTEEYQPFVAKAVEQLSTTYKIEGFRPGKVPMDVLKKRIGENVIWEEALEAAVKKTLPQAFIQQGIDTVGSPKIEIVKLAPGNPVSYKAVVNLFPKINELKIEGITLTRKKVTVAPDAVQKTLDELRRMRAKEVLVTRTAKEGDKVEVDFKVFLDKVPLENGDGKKVPIVIGEKHFIPGFEENLVGMKTNDEKEFSLKFPDSYHQKNLAGKKAEFRVKVLAVYEIQLPEMTDAFAKDLRFETMDELKSQISKNIEMQETEKEERRIEDEAVDALLAKNSFTEIPDLLLDAESKAMMDEMENSVKGQGIDFEDYLKHLKKSRTDMLLEFSPAAAKRIKAAVLFRELAKKHNLGATKEEVDHELKQHLSDHGHAHNHDHGDDFKDYLANVITSKKVTKHIKDLLVAPEKK